MADYGCRRFEPKEGPTLTNIYKCAEGEQHGELYSRIEERLNKLGFEKRGSTIFIRPKDPERGIVVEGVVVDIVALLEPRTDSVTLKLTGSSNSALEEVLRQIELLGEEGKENPVYRGTDPGTNPTAYTCR